MPNRQFYRCRDCFSVGASDSDYPILGAECSLCGGGLESMGQVYRGRLATVETQCVCDGRCVFAMGPNCECQCGGENHGAGMLGGFIEVMRDKGPIPQLTMPANSKAAAIAAEWRAGKAAIAAARAELDKLRRGDARRLPYDAWQRDIELERALRKARQLQTHRGRMRVIAAALPGYQPTQPAALLF